MSRQERNSHRWRNICSFSRSRPSSLDCMTVSTRRSQDCCHLARMNLTSIRQRLSDANRSVNRLNQTKEVGEIHSCDVMAVIVVTTSVTRQYRTRRAKLVTSKSKEETAQTEAERNKHGCTRKINMKTPCVKNLSRNNKRTTGAEDTQKTKLLLVLRFTGMAGVYTPRPGLPPHTEIRTSISK